MTKEEALKVLDTIPTIGEQVDALEMAIEALEQEPCEDCISREEAINKINTLIAEYIPLMPTGWTLPLNIARTINELPSVTPQQSTGHWMHPYKSDIACECSECHIQIPITKDFKYCPNCGARMKDGD